MFSALFGHFPNLVTLRGDRLRSAPAFVESVQRVMDLEPELLLLGHHGPLRGAALIHRECERIRDAVSYVHEATLAAMNDGQDVWSAMASIRVPAALDLGEAYGRVDWSVRAIWETYAGWYHQHSTLDLVRCATRSAARPRSSRSPADPTRSRPARDELAGYRRAHRRAVVRARARGRRREPRRARCVPRRARAAARRARRRELLAHQVAGRRDPHRDEPPGTARRLVTDPIRIDDLRAPQLDANQRAALEYVATLDITFDADAMLAAACRAGPVRRLRRARLPRPARRDDRGHRSRRRLRTARTTRRASAHVALAHVALARRGRRSAAGPRSSPSSCPRRSSSSGSRARARRISSTSSRPTRGCDPSPTGKASSRARARATDPGATASTHGSCGVAATTKRKSRWCRCCARCTISIPEAIEEEIELEDLDFASYTLEWHARVPAWRDFYLTLDQHAHYAYMKKVLQVCTYFRGPRQWVLKSPQHLEQIPALARNVSRRHIRDYTSRSGVGHHVGDHDARVRRSDAPRDDRTRGARGLLDRPGWPAARRVLAGPRPPPRRPHDRRALRRVHGSTTWRWSSASTNATTCP